MVFTFFRLRKFGVNLHMRKVRSYFGHYCIQGGPKMAQFFSVRLNFTKY